MEFQILPVHFLEMAVYHLEGGLGNFVYIPSTVKSESNATICEQPTECI